MKGGGGQNLYLSMSTQSCPQPRLVKLHTFKKKLSTRLGLAIYQNLGPPYFFFFQYLGSLKLTENDYVCPCL